ncbi:MAG: hypothetical protein QXM96_00270 [Candidatus Woesearchaeota archaeon]
MKIITNRKVILNEVYQNTDGKPTISQTQIQQQIADAGVKALTNVISNIGKKEKSEVEKICGKKPLLKKKRGAWQSCVDKYLSAQQQTQQQTQQESPETQQTETKKNNKQKNIVFLSIGIIALAAGIYYFLKTKK